ncbi:MAG: polyprenyl diphosphate synthase, partial [Candidatus Natronoplasma sp.]
AIGALNKLPERVLESIKYAEEKTKDYDNYYFNIAVAYGGREELLYAIQKVAQDVKDGDLEIKDIDEKTISDRLYTSEFPDPDLILRTSGEERISNFLIWQLAYSELYFTDVYWPGFRKIDFLRAIRSYEKRQRRYGE